MYQIMFLAIISQEQGDPFQVLTWNSSVLRQ